MAVQTQPGESVRVIIQKTITRESARKTVERLFMSDPAHRKPIAARTANFADRPKRRGGRIYTKHTHKVHLKLAKGDSAVIKATAQHLRDLDSVSAFVTVTKA
mgnify:CR=1 FL=1